MIDIHTLETLVPFILALVGGVVWLLWKGVFKKKGDATEALTPAAASVMIGVKIQDFGAERDKIGAERSKNLDERFTRIADAAERTNKAVDKLAGGVDSLTMTFVEHRGEIKTNVEHNKDTLRKLDEKADSNRKHFDRQFEDLRREITHGGRGA